MELQKPKGIGGTSALRWLIVGASFFCMLIVINEIAKEADRKTCYNRISGKNEIEASYGAIRESFYSEIQKSIVNGTPYDQTISTLRDIGPVVLIRRYPDFDGSFSDLMLLDVCFYRSNGFSYLLAFSKDGKFEEVFHYIDD